MTAAAVAQIPLALRLDEHARFATFVEEDNAAAVASVAALAAGRHMGVVWLCGPEGSGKTHLLQAACRRAGEAQLRAMYLPLDDREARADHLMGADRLGVLALDAVDAAAGRADWEARLFSVLEHFHANAGGLLLAARVPPAAVPFALPDLGSRAAGALVYRLRLLGEPGQLEALRRHASERGLELDDAAARFLLNRVRRGMPELCACLDRLDRASLAAQRRLTIPFIRSALAEQGCD